MCSVVLYCIKFPTLILAHFSIISNLPLPQTAYTITYKAIVLSEKIPKFRQRVALKISHCKMKPSAYYHCIICGRSFEKGSRFKTHIEFGHNFRGRQKKLFCCFCGKKMDNVARLFVHYVHKCERRLRCFR